MIELKEGSKGMVGKIHTESTSRRTLYFGSLAAPTSVIVLFVDPMTCSRDEVSSSFSFGSSFICT